MLVLSRKVGEQIVLPKCEVTIEVLRVSGQRVRIGVSAPPETPVHREETWNRICESGRNRTEKDLGRDEKESGNGPEVKC